MKLEFEIKNQSCGNLGKNIWFIHGFTESSACFSAVSARDELKDFELYLVNLPGFGSDPTCEIYSIEQTITSLFSLIQTQSPNGRVMIVGHSLGGALGVTLAARLLSAGREVFLLNIDGLLIPENNEKSSISQSLKFKDPDKFKEFMVDYWHKKTGQNFWLDRYFTNIKDTKAEVLHAWALNLVFLLKDNFILNKQEAIKDKTLYIYGDKSVNQRNYMAAEALGLNTLCFTEAGHWLFLENESRFVESVKHEASVFFHKKKF